MSQIIREQIYFLLTTVCCGMFVMSGYDFLRLWRWIIPHSKLWIWIEDIFYWSFLSIPVFVMFYRMIDGVLRWYGLVGMLAGGILYESGISIPLRRGLYLIFVKIHKKIGNRVAKLGKVLYSKITSPFS